MRPKKERSSAVCLVKMYRSEREAKGLSPEEHTMDLRKGGESNVPYRSGKPTTLKGFTNSSTDEQPMS